MGILSIDDSRRQEDMAQLSQLIADGRLKPVIDRIYELEDTADAFRHAIGGHVRGKIVISVP